MSETLGISLRKKKSTRPKISAPRQIVTNPENNSSQPSLQAPQWQEGPPRKSTETTASARPRPSLGGRDQTADLVKRRYSTRFTNLPTQDGLAPPVPGVPQIPRQYAGTVPPSTREGRSPERGEGQRVKVDARALRDPNLQPEQYVANILADASETDIYAYQQDLQKLKNRTSTDLQHNVYQNRTQFIKISKEADKLKTEMRVLRSLMSELTGALSHATSAGGAETNGSLADRKSSRRTSVANLEALYASHLQALWKRVEGSQKYLPAVPGRHVVHESSRWVELNAATWRPRRRVHLILLNDHFLIASEKKRADGAAGVSNSPQSKRQSLYQAPTPSSQTQLIAERCWPLQDVQMTDISSRASTRDGSERNVVANAVNVRAGGESWTFATASTSDTGGEKSALLVAFRKSVEDLRKTIAAEHGERERALDELAFLSGRDPRFLKSKGGVEGAGNVSDKGALNRSSTLIDVDGRQQSLRWVESQIDGLDIDIALQRFEEAVAKTERLRKLARGIKGNSVAQEVVVVKVDERAGKLAAVLARRLRESNTGLEATKENVGWLIRLGFEDMARISYLDSRTEVLKKRTRQLPFTGSLPPHLTALSYVTFTLLHHTIRTFQSSFPSASSSAVVKWAKDRIDDFNDHLERQLSSVERGSSLWNECIEVVKRQSGVLGDVNVEFGGLVARGMVEEREERPRGRRQRSQISLKEGVGLGLST